MQNDDDAFQFTVNDVVLADWENKLYYAKILSINHTKSKCRLLFDDGSSATADFTQIHHGKTSTLNDEAATVIRGAYKRFRIRGSM